MHSGRVKCVPGWNVLDGISSPRGIALAHRVNGRQVSGADVWEALWFRLLCMPTCATLLG